MLEHDYQQIPDLRFEIEMLIADPPHIASRLRFDVTPKADFVDLPVNGRVTRQRISVLCLSGASGGMSGRSKAEWGLKRATPFTCVSYCLKTNASSRSISEK
jgi:hypothetical protein